MTVKEKLESIERLEVLIDEKQKELSRIGSLMTFDDGSLTSKIAAYQNEVNAAIDKLIDTKQEIAAIIDNAATLTAIETKVLYLKYVDCKDWAQVAEEIYYTERHTQRIAAAALEKLENSHNYAGV